MDSIRVSVVLSSRKILSVLSPGDHGSTFGGNPLACAIARAALRVIVDEGLAARSAEFGALLLDRLQKVRSSKIIAVRGRGLWIAIELTEAARPYCEELQHQGLLCKETHGNIIRIAPPLTITLEQTLWAAEQIRGVFEGAAAR